MNKTNVLYSLSGKMITTFLDFSKEEYTFILSFFFIRDKIHEKYRFQQLF